MQKWNKKRIIAAIQKRYENKKYLDYQGLKEDNPSLLYACSNHFGSREKAIAEAGINPLLVKKHPINTSKQKSEKTQNVIQRILLMIYYINNELGTTTEYLAEKLNVSTRTIHRYIEKLREIPDIEVIYVDHKSGYEIRFTEKKDKLYNERYMYIWTTKDMKILEFLVSQGVSDEKIAQLLERSEKAIRAKKSNIKSNNK
ncbi:MAG: HTH domain-containing protein [archaeon]